MVLCSSASSEILTTLTVTVRMIVITLNIFPDLISGHPFSQSMLNMFEMPLVWLPYARCYGKQTAFMIHGLRFQVSHYFVGHEQFENNCMQSHKVIKAPRMEINMYILSTCGLDGLVWPYNTSWENHDLAWVTELGVNAEFSPPSSYSFYAFLLPFLTPHPTTATITMYLCHTMPHSWFRMRDYIVQCLSKSLQCPSMSKSSFFHWMTMFESPKLFFCC